MKTDGADSIWKKVDERVDGRTLTMSATDVKLVYLSNYAHPTPNAENGGKGICVESMLDG